MAKNIGVIQIDFLANIAKVISPLNQMSTKIDRTLAAITNTIKHFEKNVTKAGLQLTAKVTLPLVGLGVAAVKAADPTGKVSQSIERMGLQAQAALKPLGDVLIRIFEQARPTIEAVIGVLNNLASAFAALDPHTQNQIVGFAAAAAAAGPLLLVSGALLTVMRYGITTIAGVLRVASLVRGTVLGIAASLVTLHTALWKVLLPLEAFLLGRYFYENFKIVQTSAAATINILADGWEYVKTGVLLTVDAIRLAWDRAVTAFKLSLGSLFTSIGTGLDTIPLWFVMLLSGNPASGAQTAAGIAGAAATLKELGSSLSQIVGDDRSYEQILSDRMIALSSALNENAAVYEATIKNIEADFGGMESKGLSGLFGGIENLAPVAAGLEEIKGLYEQLADKARELLQVGPLPFVQTKKEVDAANEAIKKNLALAEALQNKYSTPGEKFSEDLANARQLYDLGYLSQEQFAKLSAAIQTAMQKAAAAVDNFYTRFSKVIENFGLQASQTFADFLVDGKGSMSDLIKSWEKQLIAFLSNELIFGPLFKALANNLTGPQVWLNFGGTVAPTARGNAFDSGHVMPFAAGGIVSRATLAPMALFGEAGPEAIMPLTRVRGKLGVMAGMGGGVTVQVIDQRSGGAPAEVRHERGPDGRRLVRVFIRDEFKRLLGEGAFDRSFQQTFGQARRPVAG